MASGQVTLRRTLTLSGLLVTSCVAIAAADTTDDRRALVMLRALAYDTHLDDRARDEARFVIVYADGEVGAAEARRWTAAFANIRKIKVVGRPVVVTAYKFQTEAALKRMLHELHPAALLSCDGLAGALPVPALAAITRANRVLSISTREPDVVRGLAVGIVRGPERDEIVVNIAAAAAEGVKFDAGLLQLARSVGGTR